MRLAMASQSRLRAESAEDRSAQGLPDRLDLVVALYPAGVDLGKCRSGFRMSNRATEGTEIGGGDYTRSWQVDRATW